MGYGLDTQKYPLKKWGKTIKWRYQGNLSNQFLLTAMNAWANSCGINFVQSQTGPVDFELKCIPPNTSDGGSKWSNYTIDQQGGGCGKPCTNIVGLLQLKTSTSLGSVLHEIGHLLGCSHEQDRQDQRSGWYQQHCNNPNDPWELQAAVNHAVNLKDYGNFDANSVMMYPATHYSKMSSPSSGDVATVKAINGW